MPKNIKAKRSAPQARCRAVRRKDKEEQRRKRNGQPGPAPAKLIADSLFALTLAPKKWVDTVTEEEKQDSEENGVIIYKDLFAAYNTALRLIGKLPYERPKHVHPLQAISLLVEHFKVNLLPSGFEYNINQHYENRNRVGFHFTMFAVCQGFPGFWHFFEVRPIVEKVLANNPKLHEMFIIFLSSFSRKCQLPIWFNGGLGWADYHVTSTEEEILWRLNNKAYEEDGAMATETDLVETLEEIQEARVEYTVGSAATYAEMIRSAKFHTPDQLLKKLSKFPPQHRLVKFMKNACEFMKRPAALGDFSYTQMDSDDDEGLRFDDQVSIIWDWRDAISEDQRNNLDAMVQGVGMFRPVIHARLMGKTKTFNLKALVENRDWPKRLSALWKEYNTIIQSIPGYKYE